LFLAYAPYSYYPLGHRVQTLDDVGTVDGAAVCRMFNGAISGVPSLPEYLSSDHDPLFEFHRWKANLRILDIEEIKTVPYVPISHPFIERLIGTIRREYLDQVPFWNASDLTRKLDSYRHYYNEHRVHCSLDGARPHSSVEKSRSRVAHLANYRWTSHCRSLYQLPAAA